MQLQSAQLRFIEWQSSARDLSTHTLRAYASDTSLLCRHVGEEAHVSDFTPDLIMDFVQAQRTAGISAASLRRRVSVLRIFAKWLVTSELLEIDPWSKVTLEIRKPRHLPRTLTGEDLALLLGSLAHAAGVTSGQGCLVERITRQPLRFTTLLGVVLMLVTGVRVSELVGIRTADVDYLNSSIRVLGKGSRERTVFLPDRWTSGLLSDYLEARNGIGVLHPYLLFNHQRMPMTTAAMRARLSRAATEAGVQTRVTPHMLRHSAATQLIESGVDIRYVQRLLGHASLSTTELYTHVTDPALREVMVRANVLSRHLCVDN